MKLIKQFFAWRTQARKVAAILATTLTGAIAAGVLSGHNAATAVSIVGVLSSVAAFGTANKPTA